MLKRIAAFVAIVTVACIVAIVPSMAVAQGASSGAPAKSSLIVKMAPGLSANEHAAVIAKNGGAKASSIPALGLHVIEVPTQQLETDSGQLPRRSSGRPRRGQRNPPR